MKETSFLPVLKQYFGYTSFRPLQEEIIAHALQGRDVFALLPTGGGKSLCFQLPALIQPGLTLVISPLIALMKDQVDALQASGVAATFLNSTLESNESRSRLRGLHRGQYRLLYVAPERLMLSGFLNDLQNWNVNLVAVDEAHCISEWGHDFRPEYRQLANLRDLLPRVPFMALTATATDRVRGDIVKLLALREPKCFVASFNRPNLSYRVMAKNRTYEQMLEFIQGRPRECGIVYCQSRKTAESLAARLTASKIKASAYHAGLSVEDRSRAQDLFLQDEIRVVCATIAFGMGINKPNVRYVIHYDLPKNIEGYYQETGRAGRDGLPGECLLLFSPGDVIKQMQFIDEKPNVQEQQIARAQLQQMVHYAECSTCRRSELLRYFSEDYPDDNCGSCDNCLSPRETFDGTLAAQKFLSCIYRIREKSGFGVGLNHVIEVLTGANTDKIRRWNHQNLSTYGIGQEHGRAQWGAIGRELVRLGFLRQSSEKFSTIEITNEGMAALRQRLPITLTRPVSAAEPRAHRAGEITCDEQLFERLRQARKRLAQEKGVPPYIIFSDVALRQMARDYPSNPREFSRISGVGERKLEEYGEAFLDEISDYLANYPRQMFADDDSFSAPAAPAEKTAPAINTSMRDTLERFRRGQDVARIAQERNLSQSTIYGHLAEAVAAGESLQWRQLWSAEEEEQMLGAFARARSDALAEAAKFLPGTVNYGLLKIFRAAHQGKKL